MDLSPSLVFKYEGGRTVREDVCELCGCVGTTKLDVCSSVVCQAFSLEVKRHWCVTNKFLLILNTCIGYKIGE